jgi:hypothetical protein
MNELDGGIRIGIAIEAAAAADAAAAALDAVAVKKESLNKKGPNWKKAEMDKLCTSWITVSEDSSVGSNQKSDTFWQKVHATFNAGIPDNEQRPFRSLQTKFGDINRDSCKFVGYLEFVRNLKISGINAEDELVRAMEQYRKEAKPKEGDFVYLSCWRILSSCPKWQNSAAVGENKRAADGCEILEKEAHHLGNKKAKLVAKEAENMEKSLLGMMETKSELSKKKISVLEIQNSERASFNSKRIELMERQIEATSVLSKAALMKARALKETASLAFFTTNADESLGKYLEMKRAKLMKEEEEELQ